MVGSAIGVLEAQHSVVSSHWVGLLGSALVPLWMSNLHRGEKLFHLVSHCEEGKGGPGPPKLEWEGIPAEVAGKEGQNPRTMVQLILAAGRWQQCEPSGQLRTPLDAPCAQPGRCLQFPPSSGGQLQVDSKGW